MITSVLLDLSGVLYVGDQAIPGAIEAIARLDEHRIPRCFITNTTRRTPAAVHRSLNNLGFDIALQDIFTASSAALDYIKHHRLHPHVLVHENLEQVFSAVHSDRPDAVLLGDAANAFNYTTLNRAFRVLMQNDAIPLISMGYNRYFREADGLSLDLGAFTAALEFASGRRAVIMGKPSADFFLQAVDRLGARAEEVVMIGDDVDSDVNGAVDAGLQACLVKTGKYQPGDEDRMASSAHLADDIVEAIDWLTARHRR